MSAASSTIGILVADDHPLMREGVASMIGSEPDMKILASVSNGREAITAFAEHHPDVTLMDLQMPELDGLSAISQIVERWPEARILVLTTFSGDVQTLRALKAGACGYLLKSMIRKDLLNAVRDAHRGRRRLLPQVAAQLGQHALDDQLSEREAEVLSRVASGLANKQIATQLGVSEQTVKSHMKSILAKLKANDRTHAVMIALDRGIINSWPAR